MSPVFLPVHLGSHMTLKKINCDIKKISQTRILPLTLLKKCLAGWMSVDAKIFRWSCKRYIYFLICWLIFVYSTVCIKAYCVYNIKKHFRWAKREAATYLRNTFEIVHTKFKNVDGFCAPGRGTEGHEYCRVITTIYVFAFSTKFSRKSFFRIFARIALR